MNADPHADHSSGPDSSDHHPDQVFDTEAGSSAERLRSIKRNYGTGAAMIAAAGLAINELLWGKKDDRPAAIVNASGKPPNLDDHGLDLTASDGTHIVTPALPRRPVIEVRRTSPRRRGR